MRITTEEVLHPDRWLRTVLTDEAQFYRLLYQSAGLATAAYRLAQAQCRATGHVGRPPTLAELKLAARMIAARTGRCSDLPIMAARSGLLVDSRASAVSPAQPQCRAAG